MRTILHPTSNTLTPDTIPINHKTISDQRIAFFSAVMAQTYRVAKLLKYMEVEKRCLNHRTCHSLLMLYTNKKNKSCRLMMF